MFTGLIREIANVSKFNGKVLTLKSSYKPNIGDSIAINGACLTVTELQNSGFSVELAHESQKLLATEHLKNSVHIEPAMQLGDRVEGHMVQGHVDCTGILKSITAQKDGVDFFIELPPDFMPLVISKGSIAVDGISLTVNNVEKNGFRLTIINHTMGNTLFSSYKIGRRVNIETDMFARYIFSMLNSKKDLSWSDVDHISALY